MKLELSRQIFEKHSNIKFYEIRPVVFQLLHADGRTDGQADMTKLRVV